MQAKLTDDIENDNVSGNMHADLLELSSEDVDRLKKPLHCLRELWHQYMTFRFQSSLPLEKTFHPAWILRPQVDVLEQLAEGIFIKGLENQCTAI